MTVLALPREDVSEMGFKLSYSAAAEATALTVSAASFRPCDQLHLICGGR